MRHWMTLLCICVICLVGCTSGSSMYEQAVEGEEIMAEVRTVSHEYSAMRGNLGIYEDKLLYSEIDSGKEIFYVLDFQTGLVQNVGTIENLAMSGGSKILINDTLYFHVYPYDKKSGGMVNVLYALDFSNNELSPIYRNNYTKKLIPLVNIENNLYAWQGNQTDEAYDSFFERIDEDGNPTRITIEQNDISKSTADDAVHGILYVDSDVENMYALEKTNCEQGAKYYVTKYTSDFECIRICDISSIFEDYEITQSISRFYAFGDFFFLSDYSDNAILCKCGEDEIEVLLCERNLTYAFDTCRNDELEFFYIRRTNDIYRLNLLTGVIEMPEYNLDNDNSFIRSILAYDNNLMISKRVGEEGKKEALYLISQE